MKYNNVKHPALKDFYKAKKDFKRGVRYLNGQIKTFDEYMSYIIRELIYSNEQVGISEMLFLKDYMSGDITHYFIETKELYDFLSEMEIKDFRYIESEMIEGLDYKVSPLLNEDMVPIASAKNHTGVIHYLSNESALFFTVKKYENKITIDLMRDDNIVFYGDSFDLFSIYNKGGDCFSNNPDYPKDKLILDTQLIVNMFLYFQIFPHLVITGAPDGQPIIYKESHCKMIKTEESLIDRSGVTPHFRRGHFAHLTSDRYTKSKGKYIFIRSTFVKGSAKTILDDNEARNKLK